MHVSIISILKGCTFLLKEVSFKERNRALDFLGYHGMCLCHVISKFLFDG